MPEQWYDQVRCCRVVEQHFAECDPIRDRAFVQNKAMMYRDVEDRICAVPSSKAHCIVECSV